MYYLCMLELPMYYSKVNKTVMKTQCHVTMEESKFTFLAEHLIRIMP